MITSRRIEMDKYLTRQSFYVRDKKHCDVPLVPLEEALKAIQHISMVEGFYYQRDYYPLLFIDLDLKDARYRESLIEISINLKRLGQRLRALSEHKVKE